MKLEDIIHKIHILLNNIKLDKQIKTIVEKCEEVRDDIAFFYSHGKKEESEKLFQYLSTDWSLYYDMTFYDVIIYIITHAKYPPRKEEK
jgi:hypothetical protein